MAEGLDPADWFRERGFTTSTHEDDGVWWAAVVRDDAGRAVVPRYGRGTTPEEAVAAAQRRWRVEQDGE